MSTKKKEAAKPISLTYDIDDEQEELSVDPIQLNATLLAFRPIVKKARLHVLRELAIYIKRLKQKQSVIADSKKPRIGKKILGRLSELRLLKKMNTIRLCKLLLANLSTPEEMEKAGQTMNKQDRLVVRMAVRPEVAAFVNQFRTQHADWPTLVHFLLYKNTSGKWKTSEQKRRKKKKNKGDLPFPLPASLLLANDGEGEDKELEEVDGCSTIKKFAAFKEAHDRRLLEEQKKLIADEEAEFALVPPLRPQAAISPPFRPEEAATDEMEADSDAASEIVANLIARRPLVHPSSLPKSTREEKETEAEESKGRENKSKKERPEKPPLHPPSMPPDGGALPRAEKPQKKAKKRVKSATNSDITIQTGGAIKTAAMETIESTKTAKINKPVQSAPADAFFSEVIDATESQSAPILDVEDEGLFGADDVELKKEILAKKARDGEKTPPSRGIWKRGGCGSDRRGWGIHRPPGGRGRAGGGINYSRKSQSDLDTAGLHPSWVARREQQKQAAAIISTPASGKRIVFED
uniref:Serum response factor-binding protein 1 n=1 Tax=Schistocephalus solidus TaxID=70667 RepID=A0A0V0J1E3_SCHSO